MTKPEVAKEGGPKRLEEGRGQSQDRVMALQHALGEAVRENEMLLERIMLLQALIVAAQMRDDQWGRQLASLEESESLDSLSAYSEQIRKKPYPKRKPIKGVRKLDQNVGRSGIKKS